jgi:hypothetical protein
MNALGSFFAGRQWRGRAYLISPFMDTGLAGGFALLSFPLLFVLMPASGEHFSTQLWLVTAAITWAA